ncbi:ABC transporter transmembrane domain-containing protein, partial [Onishia niordana]
AMVIAVPIATLIIMPLATFGRKFGIQRQDALAGFSGTASEVLSEIRLVKSSNAEVQATHSAEKNINKLYKIGLREAIFDGSMQPIM